MSTTNPPGGRKDPVPALAPLEPGSPAPDEATTGIPVDPATIARGHEADTYDNMSVFSVPLLVILFFVLAFATVTVIFRFIAYPAPDPTANPGAVERNSETLNKRLDRIYRGSKEVDQPRLEDLKMREGHERAITSPPTPTGNSPWVHPEDIRPSEKNTPALYRTEWIDKDKTARIPLTDAMSLVLKQQSKFLPTLPKNEQSSPLASEHRPTASNAGRGFGESTVVLPKLPEGKK